VALDEEGGPVPISSSDPSWGRRTAPVTLVEFADFQCPFCKRGSETVDKLRREYGPEKLRVVWKNLPLEFHPEALPAAEAGAAVMIAGGSDAFWAFHDVLYAHQSELSRASYAAWAKGAGVDPTKLRAAIESGAARAKVERDMAVAKAVGAMGTPMFFVNGVLLAGAQPDENFTAIIDAELVKARAKLERGVAPTALYAAMSAENFKPPATGDEEEREDTSIYRVPAGKSPARGPAGALVTIVVFSDFQCPFCKRAEETVKALEARYPGALRFVWKNVPLPFHPRAEPAAELALEARAQKGDGAFWAAHDKLFASQPALEADDLERIARELSLDVKRAMAAVKTHEHRALIEADESLAEGFHVEGTPQFFVNGRRLVGAQPASAFASVIDDALARAKAAVAGGAAPVDVYDALTKDGVGPAEPEKRTIQLASGAPSLGAPHAPVTVYMFSDFQCPFCKRVEPTLAELRKAYGAKLRIVWNNLPLSFHANAHLAAEAAMEAQAQKGDGAFWKMHDALFARQGDQGGLERAGLEQAAKAVGLDAKRFAAALDDGKHRTRVDDDAKNASRAGIAGTPAFVIVAHGASAADAGGTSVTGYFLAGAYPVEAFKKLVDRALADAKTPPKAAPKAAPAAAEANRP
jgi:protein-disulfide isomerase